MKAKVTLIIKLAIGAMCLVATALLLLVYTNVDTEYATGYTEDKFSAVRIGMAKAEVKDLLGEPLWSNASADKLKEGWEIWSYSRQGANKMANYFVRLIRFNSEGRVISKTKELYLD